MGYSLSVDLDLYSMIEQAFQTQGATAESSPRQVRQFSKGETIYSYGDRATAIYYVETGSVKLSRYTPDGKLITFRIVQAGELFGETELYLNTRTCEASVENDSRIVVYPRAQVMSCVAQDAHLAQALLHQSHLLLLHLKKRLTLLTIRSVRERVLEYFRERIAESQPAESQSAASQAAGGERTITLDRPLKDVAEELDISPEAFYRTLSQLQKDGTIQRTKRQITML